MTVQSALLQFDAGFTGPLIGVDEVGRGSWVGPVVAAAVHLPAALLDSPPDWLAQLNDSKALTAEKRQFLASLLQQHVPFAMGLASIDDIERYNLHHASLLACDRAVSALMAQWVWPQPTVLMDGCHRLPAWQGHQQAIVKGDGQSAHIAAASIIAKVHRDAMLTQWHDTYPQYQWAQNKGYGTKVHLHALSQFGPCDLHRPRFLKKWQATQP